MKNPSTENTFRKTQHNDIYCIFSTAEQSLNPHSLWSVHQQRSNLRVILTLFFISTSSRVAVQAIISLLQQIIHLKQWLFIICHHKPKNMHTSLQPMERLTSLIKTLSTKVEKLISEIVLYCFGCCVFYPSHIYMVYVHVLLFWHMLLSFCLNTSHTATGVMKIDMSETP